MLGQRFEAGSFIEFTYNPPPPKPRGPRTTQERRRRPDGSYVWVTVTYPAKPLPPQPPHDPNKSVFVLHPNFQGKCHALDLKRLTPAQVQIIHAFMNPRIKAEVDAGKWPVDGAPNFPLLRDVLHRMDPPELIKQPMVFYQRLVKPFIGQSDCYRRYDVTFMFNVRILNENKGSGGGGVPPNPNPLFHK